jgi:hypothetical protein
MNNKQLLDSFVDKDKQAEFINLLEKHGVKYRIDSFVFDEVVVKGDRQLGHKDLISVFFKNKKIQSIIFHKNSPKTEILNLNQELQDWLGFT